MIRLIGTEQLWHTMHYIATIRTRELRFKTLTDGLTTCWLDYFLVNWPTASTGDIQSTHRASRRCPQCI